jgi:hypothetical protein
MPNRFFVTRTTFTTKTAAPISPAYARADAHAQQLRYRAELFKDAKNGLSGDDTREGVICVIHVKHPTPASILRRRASWSRATSKAS